MCETAARSNFDSKSHDCTHSVTPPELNFHSAWAEFSLGLGWVKTSNVKVTFLPSPQATLLGWIQYSGYFVPMYLLVAWRMEMHLNIPHTEQQEFFLQNWVLPGYIFGLHNCTKNAKEVYPCSPLLLATLAGLQLLPLLFDHLNQFLPVRGLFRLDDKRFVEFNKGVWGRGGACEKNATGEKSWCVKLCSIALSKVVWVTESCIDTRVAIQIESWAEWKKLKLVWTNSETAQRKELLSEPTKAQLRFGAACHCAG